MMTATDLNQHCIDTLKGMDLSDYIVVVGSGPSCPYIAPSWKLQENLISRCGIDKLDNEPFWKLAQRAHDANTSEYHQIILDLYGASPYWEAETYKHIAAIGFKGYITFNYDNQLPKACREAMGLNFDKAFSVYPPRSGSRFKGSSAFLATPPQVAPIHGYYDIHNPNWHRELILKESDYDRHYTDGDTNHLFEFWSHILTFANCLFLGTSLEEPGLHQVIEILKQERPDSLMERKHLLLRDVKPHPSSGKYPNPQKMFGEIEEIHFDKINDHYEGLIKVLGAFSSLPTDSPSPVVPAIQSIQKKNNFNFYE